MYMLMSRNDMNTKDLLVGSMLFGAVYNFSYLGANINNKNNIHQEVDKRIVSGIKCYYSIIKILKSKLLSWTFKIRFYLYYLWPIVTYVSETWSLMKCDERKLSKF